MAVRTQGGTVLPTGTVTFLFSDIEGSTRLVHSLGDRYGELLEDHHRIMRGAIASSGGTELGTEGDSFFAVFPTAAQAIEATVAAHRALAEHTWPDEAAVLVRMGLHTGDGKLGGDNYIGLDVHRTSRIAAAGHGGQVLVSETTRSLVASALPAGASLRDLGEHRLKDLESPEHLFQLVAAGLRETFPPLRSLDARAVHLPTQMSSFVGRTREKDVLLELLAKERIVTLTGPGGTGKTRLSVEVASQAADAFDDGAIFVPLAPISDPELVGPTIAAALGLREGPAGDTFETLVEHLRDRSLLLILDNFEQVMPAARTVGELVARAPRVKVLVSSREPLRISGEQEFLVPPLALPGRAGDVRLDELRAVDSVALFVQRAGAVRSGFDLTLENAPAVTEICARLDGLPLAIELAAARVRLFEPADILARLDRRLSFLAGGRDVSERQRTLRGAIDWSHELLDHGEQTVFRRLSVFAGGTTIEAIEAVCQPDQLGLDAADVVSSLHDKSLLRRADGPGALRVSMLETIREYGLERLEAAGEGGELRRRHALHYLALAEDTAEHVNGPDQRRCSRCSRSIWTTSEQRSSGRSRAATSRWGSGSRVRSTRSGSFATTSRKAAGWWQSSSPCRQPPSRSRSSRPASVSQPTSRYGSRTTPWQVR